MGITAGVERCKRFTQLIGDVAVVETDFGAAAGDRQAVAGLHCLGVAAEGGLSAQREEIAYLERRVQLQAGADAVITG